LAARSKTALIRLEDGTADNAAAFIDDSSSMFEILAGSEDVGVHQMMGLLLGSAATSRTQHSGPTTFHTSKRA